ncbi:tannase/feruloyl esterase family alpha/beta hydrolase [Nocardia sp. NPDC058705]|uniref:tannase/feruloyl esterase family alpha/beta hydrolase n=1 Tax=Nocardia sp. NPDC058705 TaxID=3346609 RepID=UPI0036D17E12
MVNNRPFRLRTQLAAGLVAVVCATTVGCSDGETSNSTTSARPSAAPTASDCSTLESIEFAEFDVVTATVVPTGPRTMTSENGIPIQTELPELCEVVAVRTDADANKVTETLWLPTTTWNGRFQGVGGGGYSCGPKYTALEAAVKAGYAAVTTNCGNAGGSGDAAFLLNDDGSVNTTLMRNWAYDAIHWMTRDGKEITAKYYQQAPSYTYFNGCSTGGRQAMSEAQRFPDDYDGILAESPALNWTKFVPSEMWAQLAMKMANNPLPLCKQDAFSVAAVAACDPEDGVTDGVIMGTCTWDPRRIVGTATECGVITQADADVMSSIWDGPRGEDGRQLWFGPPRGTDVAGEISPGFGPSGVSYTEQQNDQLVGVPFPITEAWFANSLVRDRNWDWKTLTPEQYTQLFHYSIAQFGAIMDTDNPDLSAFENSGGKLIAWHGTGDNQIFSPGTEQYFDRVHSTMGGRSTVDEFARLFIAPGVGHCRGGQGPIPTDPLNALVAWVENGVAPDTLRATMPEGAPAAGRVIPLCPYPSRIDYVGPNPDDQASYRCQS